MCLYEAHKKNARTSQRNETDKNTARGREDLAWPGTGG